MLDTVLSRCVALLGCATLIGVLVHLNNKRSRHSEAPPASTNVYEAARRCCGEQAEPERKVPHWHPQSSCSHEQGVVQAVLQQQVFISHTGQDKDATTFAACILKPALERAGMRVYMDYSDLKLGQHWKHELVKTAANSQVVVVVLSKSYTSRFWCMLELDLALNGHPGDGPKPVIIPIFYDEWDEVISGPGEVTRSGVTAEWRGADAEWSGRGLQQCLKDEELGGEWQACVDARRWVTNVHAMKDRFQHLRPSASRGKAAELDMAQGVVLQARKAIALDVDVSKIIGLRKHSDELLAHLATASLGLWLYGLGGFGKTTMATYLFWRLAGHDPNNRCASSGPFQHTAMVDIGINEGDMKRCLTCALGCLGDTVQTHLSNGQLAMQLQACVKAKKVLYVLDNVQTYEQLDALLPAEWGEGSVVIVTSRLAPSEFTSSEVWPQVKDGMHHHSVRGLDEGHDVELFRKFSMITDLPADLVDVEQDIVAGCNGLPLALKLAGAGMHRCDLNSADWKAVRASLTKEERVKGLLEHFWKKLEAPSKNMFLDVATLLRHRSYEEVKPVWSAWHGSLASLAFQDLQRRCLVELKEDTGEFSQTKGQKLMEMHDLLAELGRAKVLDPEDKEHCGSRLWVEGRKVMGCEKAAAKGAKVLCAQLDWDHVVNDWNYFFWTGAPPTMPGAALDLSQARILLLGRRTKEYSAVGTAVWVSVHEALNVGDWVDTAKGLVLLRATRCSVQETLLESLGELSALRELNLRGCSGLSVLPEGVGQLSALQTLDLGECSGLSVLPEGMWQLSALQELDLTGCSGLSVLPEGVGQLSALQTLNLEDCSGLNVLPKGVGQLSALQTLNLSLCSGLSVLPEWVGQLSALQTLYLRGCSGLSALPEGVHKLVAGGLRVIR